jgi:hypothetical protein
MHHGDTGNSDVQTSVDVVTCHRMASAVWAARLHPRSVSGCAAARLGFPEPLSSTRGSSVACAPTAKIMSTLMATYLAQNPENTPILSAKNWRNLYNFILCMCAKSGRQSVHSISSSALTSKCRGTVRPSALAVLRFTTSSNAVCWTTGKSAGLTPLRICPVYTPT